MTSREQISLFDEKSFQTHKGFFLGLDKICVLLVVFLIILVIVYSVGVERGKKIVSSATVESVSVIDLNKPTNFADAVKVEKTVQVETPDLINQPEINEETIEKETVIVKAEPVATIEKVKEEKPNTKGDYIVQLASYAKRSYASAAVATLEKNGYKAIVLEKGNWFILAVGYFETKEAAQTTLSKLKPKYKDCFIRKK